MRSRHKGKIRKLSVMETYEPLPHQKRFHQSMAKYRAMVSGVGGGKSLMGAKEILKWCSLYPGSLHVIGRLTAKSLRETTQKRFFEICPDELIYDWNKTEGHLWLRTPQPGIYSEILFMHLDDPGPLGSLDISSFWIDEAHEPEGEEVPESTFQMLQARLRNEIGPHRGIVTTNSGGKDWVYRNFFHPEKLLRDQRAMEQYHEDIAEGKHRHKPDTFWGEVVPTKANPFLPPGYEENLRRNNPEHWVKRFLEASFDVFEGQIFPEFDDSNDSLEKPPLERHTYYEGEIEISPFWRHERGFDFGVSAPTTVLYGALMPVDGEEHLVIYDSLYTPEAEPDKVAKHIKTRGFDYVYADPSTQYRGADKKSPADLYMSEGILLLPSSNDEETFFSLLHRHLRNNTIHINRDTCNELIEEIKSATWDSSVLSGKGSKEKAKKSLKFPDHARDGLKYLMLGLGAFNQNQKLSPVEPGKKRSKSKYPDDHPSFQEDEDNDPWANLMGGEDEWLENFS